MESAICYRVSRQHQGPYILTANLRKQIDRNVSARRFHFVVTLPRPKPERCLAASSKRPEPQIWILRWWRIWY